MQQQTFILTNRYGLHVRAAAKFVDVAKRYISRIEIHYLQKTINAKSIMAVMSLGATQGAEIQLWLEGEDEQEALQALAQLIEAKFGDPE